MERFIPVVVIKELSETDKILRALENNGINCASIFWRRVRLSADRSAFVTEHIPR